MSKLRENLLKIRENIESAAKKSGRRAEDITLIGVTKTVEIEHIREIMSLGVVKLGENKVQELLDKYGQFSEEPEWHMIGHLQTNKVKFIMDKVTMIQSVDSVRLAAEIDKRAEQRGKRMDILVEVNVGEEDTKYGVTRGQTEEFIEHLCKFPNICVKGLMCIAPYVKNADENRALYDKMFKLFVDTRAVFTHNTDMRFLSMGMTNDYTVAIEEGANMVRIGTALFGTRATSSN